jgi:hypothetical protein
LGSTFLNNKWRLKTHQQQERVPAVGECLTGCGVIYSQLVLSNPPHPQKKACKQQTYSIFAPTPAYPLSAPLNMELPI